MTRFAAVALLGAMLAPARAQDKKDEPTPAPSALDQRVTIDSGATIQEHLDRLQKVTGARVLVDSGESLTLSRQLDLRVKDMPAATLLRWIARFSGGHARPTEEGLVLLTARRSDAEPPVRRTYTPRTPFSGTVDLSGGRIEIPDGREPGIRVAAALKPAEGEDGGCPLSETLIDLIKENIAPGSWEGDQTLDRDLQGRLLAHCPPLVHQQIEAFLRTIDSIPAPGVTVAATIADAEGAAAPILQSILPRVLAAEEIEPLLALLRKGPTKEIQVAGTDTQRVHTLSSRESSGPVSYVKGKAILKSRVAEAELLDVLPAVGRGGRAVQVQLRLSIGETRDLDPVPTAPGPLPIQDRAVTRLSTTFLVPNGGAVLFVLPSRDRSRPVPRLCLLRADAGKPEPEAPRSRRPFPEPLRDAEAERLAERLAQAPAADLDLKDAPISEFATWLHRAGFNVVIDPQVGEVNLSLHVKAIRPAAALRLALAPKQLDYTVGDGAILIAPRICLKTPIKLLILDARDAAIAPSDFGREADARNGCSFDDLCNLIKNTVHKNEWEEADGKSIQTTRGFLFIRNTEKMLRECEQFVEEQRSPALKRVALRAEILSVSSEEVEKATRNRAARSFLIDAAQRDRLLAAGERLERLGWISVQNQKTLLEWERARDYVEEAAGDSASLRACKTLSFLEVRPMLDSDGETFDVTLSYQDQHLLDLREEKSGDRLVQSPVLGQISTKTKVEIPSGRTALFRWTGAAKDGGPARAHLLLLTPSLIP